jgi:hypothetical protein
VTTTHRGSDAKNQTSRGRDYRQSLSGRPDTSPPTSPPSLPTMSKTVQSGLRTVKRDFSVSSAPPSSSQEIIWPPTPISQPPQLTGIEQRLKAIQDALAEMPAPPQRPNALVESKALNKRPSSDADAAPAFKKPRQLPSSWREKDPLSAPSLSSRSSSGSQSAIKRKHFTPSSTSTPPVSKVSTALNSNHKVPAVFLSQEQTQILRLVKDGKSIFYTGSAGQSICA